MSVRAVYVRTAGNTAPVEAVEACAELGVALFQPDGSERFKRLVKDPSESLYRHGLTPNPCAMCNAGVKLAIPFEMLLAGELLVTGHYASFRNGFLERGADSTRDQSYFLSMVPRGILQRCFFPLELSMKRDVRQEALESGLPFLRKESRDLCFEMSRRGQPGEILDTSGVRVGEHTGLEAYTPGQRKGIGAHGERMYVVRLDPASNTVVIGDEEALYTSSCRLNSINWLREPPSSGFTCMVQVRYRKKPTLAVVVPDPGGSSAFVEFRSLQKALAPGQLGVMYQQNAVLGGGLISVGEGGL
jgi:tRNA-uridine 2-sulfurtransferase